MGTQRFVIDEVAETYKRLNQMKCGVTDNKEPKSFKFRDSLQRKHSVQKQVEQNVNIILIMLVSSRSREFNDEKDPIHTQ